jgi:hypothetical protein
MGKAITMNDIKAFGFATEDFIAEKTNAALGNLPEATLKTAEPFTLAADVDKQYAWYFRHGEHGDGLPYVYVVAKYLDENGEEICVPAKYEFNATTDTSWIGVLVHRTVENTDMTFYILSNYQPYYGSGM